MIRTIIKQMWAERKSNGWLVAELILAGAFLWYISDRFLVDYYTYIQPTGFDVSNTYRIKLKNFSGTDSRFTDKDDSAIETEDLLLMMQRLKQLPEVENCSASFYSCFYSRGNSNKNLVADNETVTDPKNVEYYNYRRVTPEFFALSHILSENGEKINVDNLPHNAVIITSDLRDKLFPDKNAIGKIVYSFYGTDTIRYTVAAVTTPIRNIEYEKNDPCIFECMIGPVLINNVKQFGATNAELLIRIKPEADHDFVNTFTKQMGERLTINNLYVSGIEPVTKMREFRMNWYWSQQKTELSLFGFVLLNIFFGIIATFWLHTGYRQEEMGLRIALGANSKNLLSMLFIEGICLLGITILPVVIIALNIVNMDYMDTFRMPFTFWRFLTGLAITYGLMLIMIMLGIWYPARTASRLNPVEALRYE